MKSDIYQSLRRKKPFHILAPMEDVTDTVFRQIVAGCGRPDLFFTEFTSCDGLCSEGEEQVAHRLKFNETEHPIVAQIWGTNPETHMQTAKLVAELGFDGIDINMGCPVAKIVKLGACSALIKNPTLAAEIIAATREGARDLPLSVKTRIGFDEISTEEWCGFLLEQRLDMLTVHGRIASEMSKQPANWDEIGKVVQLRDSGGYPTLITGNGDIKSLFEARAMYEKYGVDGVMIGRGIFENPWLFNEKVDPADITSQEKIRLFIKHLQLYSDVWGSMKNFAIMKKFVKTYINGFSGAADLRNELMQLEDSDQFVERLQILASID